MRLQVWAKETKEILIKYPVTFPPQDQQPSHFILELDIYIVRGWKG